jgi:ribosomal RNA-processing protein 9
MDHPAVSTDLFGNRQCVCNRKCSLKKTILMKLCSAHALSGSKDHSVLLWDVESSRKIFVICPNWKKQDSEGSSRSDGHVLAVAYSEDGRFAAVGSRDAVVRIFDVLVNSKVAANGNNGLQRSNMVKKFRGHKGAIPALCFQSNTPQLFSASEDRCIRSYNLDEMMQSEALHGHQLGATAMDCYQKERPVSVGCD